MKESILDLLDKEELTLEEYLSNVSDEDIEKLILDNEELEELIKEVGYEFKL